MPEVLHPTPKRSDARRLMLEMLHPVAMKLNALANLSDCEMPVDDATSFAMKMVRSESPLLMQRHSL